MTEAFARWAVLAARRRAPLPAPAAPRLAAGKRRSEATLLVAVCLAFACAAAWSAVAARLPL